MDLKVSSANDENEYFIPGEGINSCETQSSGKRGRREKSFQEFIYSSLSVECKSSEARNKRTPLSAFQEANALSSTARTLFFSMPLDFCTQNDSTDGILSCFSFFFFFSDGSVECNTSGD